MLRTPYWRHELWDCIPGAKYLGLHLAW